MSQAFRGACRAMGITLQPSHEGSPWEKGTVETSFSAVGTLFAQHVAGYAGSSVENRGKDPDGGAAWSMAELQDLLDEWLVTTWQARPHAGLCHPLMPGRALSPNEMYAALVETAGYVPVPLAASDYVELLPATWRKVNAYGVKVGNRTYDCKALSPCRGQHSGVNARNGLWETHFDPHDVTRIWIGDHLGDGGWILAPWTRLRAAPAPFGEQAWGHARKMLARRGEDPATEDEIARAAAALLDRAGQGPPRGREERRDRQAARPANAQSPAPPAVPAPAARPPSRHRPPRAADRRGDDPRRGGRRAGRAAHPADPPGDQRPPRPDRVRAADHRQDHRPQAARPHPRADGPRALPRPRGRPDPGRLRDHPAQGIAPQARHGVRPVPRPAPGQAGLQHHRHRRRPLPGHAL